ncbi:MAG: hypothetical protein ABSH09_21475 [Bryobacteraceae bacterium]
MHSINAFTITWVYLIAKVPSACSMIGQFAARSSTNDGRFVHTWSTVKPQHFNVESLSGADVLYDWHKKLHKGFVAGEFIYPTMHCPAKPDLWQVGVDFGDPLAP